MPAFGENIRREREMRGVSLEEISSATKISMRFLEAIEREDFSKLPGGIFSRSFIRSYARYLGLDEERVVTEYQIAAHPQTDFDLHRMVSGNTSARPASRTPLIATVIAVALLATGYVLFRYAPHPTEAPAPPPPAPATESKAVTPPGTPVPMASGDTTAPPGMNPAAGGVTPGATSPASTTTGPTPNSPVAPATPPGTAVTGVNPPAQPSPQSGSPPGANLAADTDLVLQVAATERTWMAVDADGKMVLQRVLVPQEVKTVKAHKSFDVTTGNAQGVILTLNGETLKPLGRHGEVKTVHLTREDLKNPAP
jgi:cytoskeletal protein RodZ